MFFLLLFGVAASALRARQFIIQTTDERGQYFERGIHVIIDVGVRWVEANNEKVVYSFVRKQE